MEAAVIAAAVKYKGCRPAVLEHLTEDHFHTPQHKPIFRALRTLVTETDQIDGAILKARLRQTGEIYEVAGSLDARVAESIVDKVILDAPPTQENIESYIIELKRLRMRRRMEEFAKGLLADAHVGAISQKPIEGVLDDAAAELVAIGQDAPRQPEGLQLETIWDEAKRVKAGEKLPVVPTGFPTLDAALDGGGRRGEMSVEAAFPGIGKTSQAVNKILNLMLNTDLRAALFSLEQMPKQLVAKMVAILSGVPYKIIRQRAWIGTHHEKGVREAFDRIAQWESERRLVIENVSGCDAQTIRGRVLRLKAGKGLDLCYVDYLQLMSGRANGESADTINAARNSTALKRLAMDADVFMCLISQMNRKGRESAEPEMWHMKQTGALEQDADIIQILYEDSVAAKQSDNGIVIARRRLKLCKNRDSEILVGSKALVLDYIVGTQYMREHRWDNVY